MTGKPRGEVARGAHAVLGQVVTLTANLAGHAASGSFVAVLQRRNPHLSDEPLRQPHHICGEKSPPASTIASSSGQHISPDTKLPANSSGPMPAHG